VTLINPHRSIRFRPATAENTYPELSAPLPGSVKWCAQELSRPGGSGKAIEVPNTRRGIPLKKLSPYWPGGIANARAGNIPGDPAANQPITWTRFVTPFFCFFSGAIPWAKSRMSTMMNHGTNEELEPRSMTVPLRPNRGHGFNDAVSSYVFHVDHRTGDPSGAVAHPGGNRDEVICTFRVVTRRSVLASQGHDGEATSP